MSVFRQLSVYAIALTAGLPAAAQPMSQVSIGKAPLADVGCTTLPRPINEYIGRQAGWRVLVLKDLLADEQALWSQGHLGQCPGIVRINFDGTSRGWYAVALVRQVENVLHERLDLLDAAHSAFSTSLTKDWDVSGPWVIFKAGPGNYTDIETGKRVVTRFDGVVFEKMESADHLYYLSDGRVRDIMLSD